MILWKAICSNGSSGINDVGGSREMGDVELGVVNSVVFLSVPLGRTGEAVNLCTGDSVRASSVTPGGEG